MLNLCLEEARRRWVVQVSHGGCGLGSLSLESAVARGGGSSCLRTAGISCVHMLRGMFSDARCANKSNAGQEQRWDLLCVLLGALSSGGAEVCGWWLRGSEISLKQRLLKDVQLC